MSSGESEVVIVTVNGNVLHVSLAHLLNSLVDVFDTTFLSHQFGGVVGVATSSVPVTLERLGVEGDLDTPLFADAEEKEASHGQMVTHLDALARADLELPLGRHDFGIDTGDLDTSVQAGSVVGFDGVTGEDFAGT